VIVYFFLGGISGGAQVLASLSGLFGGRRSAGLTRVARYLAFATFLPCPPLLILDLQRPERFLHMLRVLKLRSPMSIGSWVIVAFGGAVSLGALDQAAQDGHLPAPLSRRRHSRLSRATHVAGLPLGLLLAGYTGVLLAATAVPLWTRRALFLGPLFLASALSTAAAATELLARVTRDGRGGSPALHRIERTAMLSESLVLLVWLARLGRSGRPLAAGPLARWIHHGVAGVGLALPAALHAIAPLFGTKGQSAARALAGAATLAGGFALRATVVIGGNESADDLEATFEITSATRALPSSSRGRGVEGEGSRPTAPRP